MGCTCSSVKKREMQWCWRLKRPLAKLRDYRSILDKRREELLLEIDKFDDYEDYSTCLVDEWIALTKERNLAFQQAVDEEKKLRLHEYLSELRKWLQNIWNDPEAAKLLPASLQFSLDRCRTDVMEYLEQEKPIDESSFSSRETLIPEKQSTPSSVMGSIPNEEVPSTPYADSSPLSQRYESNSSKKFRLRAYSEPDFSVKRQGPEDERAIRAADRVGWSPRSGSKTGFSTPDSTLDTYSTASSGGPLEKVFRSAPYRHFGGIVPAAPLQMNGRIVEESDSDGSVD